MRITKLVLLLTAMIALASCQSKKEMEWQVYGGNKASTHYSPLTEVDTSNVTQLQVAWEYHTGDADGKTQIQVNPIIVNGIMYGVSPKLKLFALDAANG